MTDHPTGAGHNRLGTLAAEIAEHHGAAGAATRDAIRHAVEAGRRLAEAKELVGHGGWLAWLKANVPGISPRTAQRYLAAAHHAGENATVSFFRLRDLARRPRPKRKPSFEELEAAAQAEKWRYFEMIEAVVADMGAPGAYEAFRRAQEVGLRAGDLHVDAIHELRRRMAGELAKIASTLSDVRARLSPEQWPLWLRGSFGWSADDAALLVEAAAAVKAGQPFDVERVFGLLTTPEMAAAE
jgi:hypothetical protein